MYVMSLKALLMLALVLLFNAELFLNAELFFVIMVVTFPLVLVRDVRRLRVVVLGAYLLFHNSLCCYPPG